MSSNLKTISLVLSNLNQFPCLTLSEEPSNQWLVTECGRSVARHSSGTTLMTNLSQLKLPITKPKIWRNYSGRCVMIKLCIN